MNIDRLEKIVNFYIKKLGSCLENKELKQLLKLIQEAIKILRDQRKISVLMKSDEQGQHNSKPQIELSIKEHIKQLEKTTCLNGFQNSY